MSVCAWARVHMHECNACVHACVNVCVRARLRAAACAWVRLCVRRAWAGTHTCAFHWPQARCPVRARQALDQLLVVRVREV